MLIFPIRITYNEICDLDRKGARDLHRHILSYGCFVLSLLILFMTGASLLTSAKFVPTDVPLPTVSAQSAIMLEADNRQIVYEKNAHIPLPMASTTKIMTAIVALESADPAMAVTVTADAVGIEGSSIYLYEGEVLSLEHLLYALLLESANDAAMAIAIAVSGTEEAFVSLMNQKAASLGLMNTHFTNPHGLDHENHYTSASDLAILAAYCMQNESFRAIVSTQRMTIPLDDQEGVRLLLNHNRLLRSYKGTIGLKTGFTKRSGRCLVSAAERDGVMLIAVTLNAPDDWDDHKSLLDYGFSQFRSVLLQSQGSYTRAVPLIGMQQSSVEIYNRSEVRVTLPQSHGDIQMICQAPRWLSGTIFEGQTLGYLVWYCDNEIIATAPLIARSTIPLQTGKKSWWSRLRLLFT